MKYIYETSILNTKISPRGIAESIVWFIIIFPLAYPYSLNSILPRRLKIILLGLMCLSFIFCFISQIVFYGLDKLTFSLILYCGFFCFSTLVNGGNLLAVLVTSPDFSLVRVLGICSAVRLYFKKNPYKYVSLFLRYYEILILINLVSIVLYPNGMYQTGHSENYILGYDNVHTTTFFFSITLSFYNDYLNGSNKMSTRTKFLLLIIHISVLLRMSATTVLQLILFDFLMLFKKYIHKSKLFSNAYMAIGLLLLGTIFIVSYSNLFNSNLVRMVVTGLLHKDVTFTGRTFIWNRAVQLIKESMLIGHGFDVNAALRDFRSVGIAYHAHNQVLTDLYCGGFILLFFLLVILNLTANKINKSTQNLHIYYLIIFYVTLFHWCAESMHLILQLAIFASMYNQTPWIQTKDKVQQIKVIK